MEIRYEPSLFLSEKYDSNLDLTTGQEQSAFLFSNVTSPRRTFECFTFGES